MIEWLEATYGYRLAIGLTFFAVLLVHDLVRNRENPRRAKEYLFLAFTAAVAVLYAEVHDQITVTISPGYFVKAKGVRGAFLRSDTAALALKAAYGPGLIAGALLLIANNPSKRLEQLPYARLVRLVLVPLASAVVCAVAGGFVGRFAPPSEILDDARATFQPGYVEKFLIVWGVHWGSYVGLALGTLVAIVLVRRSRAPRVEATIPA